MTDKKSLLNDIRALDFALLETGLYLDAYDSSEAKAYFQATVEARNRLTCEYEKQYGALRSESGVIDCTWAWTKGPWPWESEAN